MHLLPSSRYAPCILTESPDRAKRNAKHLFVSSLARDLFWQRARYKPSLGLQLQLDGRETRSCGEPCPEPLAGAADARRSLHYYCKYSKRQHKTDTK